MISLVNKNDKIKWKDKRGYIEELQHINKLWTDEAKNKLQGILAFFIVDSAGLVRIH